MYFLGWFDGELRQDAWFDAELHPEGWWDTEIIDSTPDAPEEASSGLLVPLLRRRRR